MVERWGVVVGEEFSSFLGAKTSRDILRSLVELQFLNIELKFILDLLAHNMLIYMHLHLTSISSCSRKYFE